MSSGGGSAVETTCPSRRKVSPGVSSQSQPGGQIADGRFGLAANHAVDARQFEHLLRPHGAVKAGEQELAGDRPDRFDRGHQRGKLQRGTLPAVQGGTGDDGHVGPAQAGGHGLRRKVFGLAVDQPHFVSAGFENRRAVQQFQRRPAAIVGVVRARNRVAPRRFDEGDVHVRHVPACRFQFYRPGVLRVQRRHFFNNRTGLLRLMALDGDLGQPVIGVGPRPADIQHVNEAALGLLQLALLECLAALGKEIVGKILHGGPRFVGAAVRSWRGPWPAPGRR